MLEDNFALPFGEYLSVFLPNQEYRDPLSNFIVGLKKVFARPSARPLLYRRTRLLDYDDGWHGRSEGRWKQFGDSFFPLPLGDVFP